MGSGGTNTARAYHGQWFLEFFEINFFGGLALQGALERSLSGALQMFETPYCPPF
jgi:hypothetical protein